MQVWRVEKLLFGKGLNLRQKLCYFASLYFYWMSYQKLFYVLTPIISLFFGIFALVTDPDSYASFFLPYFLLNLACSILLQGGLRNFMLGEQFNLLKMHVLMKTIGGLFKRDSLFSVTPKAQASAARATEVLLPLFLLVALAAALGAGIFRIRLAPAGGYYFWALAVNIFWAAVCIVMIGGVVRHSLQRKELRMSYRFPARLDVRMRVTYPDQNGESITRKQFARNLNRFGVSLTMENAIACGTPVKLELRLAEKKIEAAGKVVRNQPYRVNGTTRVSSGIRFDQIALQDQDEISKYLFWRIAPQEGRVLHLTHNSQTEVETV